MCVRVCVYVCVLLIIYKAYKTKDEFTAYNVERTL